MSFCRTGTLARLFFRRTGLPALPACLLLPDESRYKPGAGFARQPKWHGPPVVDLAKHAVRQGSLARSTTKNLRGVQRFLLTPA